MPRIVLLLLLALAGAGLAPEPLAAEPLQPKVQVGYYEFPPYAYSDELGQPRGAFLRLTRRLLRHAGYQVEIRSYPSTRLYHGLLDGSVHLWPGAPGKRELREHTLESRTQAGEIQLNLYHLPGTPTPRLPEDLRGRRVILITGYTYWKPYSDWLADPNLGVLSDRTAQHSSALEMLQRGRGDFLLDYQTPVEQARRGLEMPALPFVELQRIPLKFIVSRHAPDAEALRDALDRAYQELSAAGAKLDLP